MEEQKEQIEKQSDKKKLMELVLEKEKTRGTTSSFTEFDPDAQL